MLFFKGLDTASVNLNALVRYRFLDYSTPYVLLICLVWLLGRLRKRNYGENPLKNSGFWLLNDKTWLPDKVDDIADFIC